MTPRTVMLVVLLLVGTQPGVHAVWGQTPPQSAVIVDGLDRGVASAVALALRDALGAKGEVIVPDDTVRAARAFVQQDPELPLDDATAQQLSARLNARILVLSARRPKNQNWMLELRAVERDSIMREYGEAAQDAIGREAVRLLQALKPPSSTTSSTLPQAGTSPPSTKAPGDAASSAPPSSASSAPTVQGAAEPEVRPTFSTRMIKEALAPVIDSVKQCGAGHSSVNIVHIAVRVDAGGQITNAAIEEEIDESLSVCLTSRIRAAQFAATVDGGSFRYPITWSPDSTQSDVGVASSSSDTEARPSLNTTALVAIGSVGGYGYGVGLRYDRRIRDVGRGWVGVGGNAGVLYADSEIMSYHSVLVPISATGSWRAGTQSAEGGLRAGISSAFVYTSGDAGWTLDLASKFLVGAEGSVRVGDRTRLYGGVDAVLGGGNAVLFSVGVVL